MNIHSILKSALVTIILFIGTAQAATIVVDDPTGSDTVNGTCSISEAIQAANTDMAVDGCTSGSIGSDTIELPFDIFLTEAFQNNTLGSTGTPAITSEIILDGQGFSISRTGGCTIDGTNATNEYRIMRVGTAGDLTLKNITLSNGCADGAGISNAGGAIFNRSNLAVENSTFLGNSANRGAGIYNDEILTLIKGSTFSGNNANTSGGGIENNDTITTIENSTFSGNLALTNGGGIYNNSSVAIATIQNSTFSGNNSGIGGGIRNDGTISIVRNTLFHQNGGSADCTNTNSMNGSNNLSDNASSGCPGVSTTLTTSTIGPLADNGGPTWTHALLPSSEAIDAGNADSTATDQRGTNAFGPRDIGAYESTTCPIALQTDGFTTSVANSAELNKAIECANLNGDANGGDTINLSADITLTTEYVSDASTGTATITTPININGMGFSILRDAGLTCNLNGVNTLAEFRIIRIGATGDLTLNNITLSNGCANGSGDANYGGAIWNAGDLSIENSTISGNSARILGGGLHNKGTIPTIQNSTFSGNSGPTGGGIHNFSTITTIGNSTFSGNSGVNGGGIYNRSNITTIQNTTFSGNSADTNGSGIRNDNGTIVTLRNSLFHNNTSAGTECANGIGASINGVNNLSDDTNSDCPDVSTTLTTSTVGSLADNGGPTMTHALLPNSEAIDAGNGDSTATDQRGFAANGTRDIGAFEAQPLELCTLALRSDGFTTSVANSAELNEAIECANLNGDANGGDTINLSTDITLNTAFEEDVIFGSTGTVAIASPIILDGMDFSIVRDDSPTCLLNGTSTSTEFRLLRIGNTGDLTLNNITLSNGCADGTGSARNGGGILNEGVLSIENSIISGNFADNRAGGIENKTGGIIRNIQNSTFSGNTATNGGGIYNQGIIFTTQNSTFSGNNAGIGAGIFNNNSIITIQNTTFSGNSASSGGGIENRDAINTIQNSTFSGNSAFTNGGGIRNFNGTIGTLRNSLLHNNTSGGTECAHGGTGSINGSNNLSDNLTSNCPDVSLLTTSTVGSLADNGGPTMTHALLPGSEAIDAGNGDSTTTDQRGTNAFGPRDIGAFEAATLSELCPINLVSDSFTTSVANVTELNQAISCANLNGSGTDTINLSADIILTTAFEEDDTFGSTGVATIKSSIILDGMDFTIMRDGICTIDSINDLSEFRLLRIGLSGTLTLNNIILSNGCANSDGNSSGHVNDGGAIFNEGVLSIENSTISGNSAQINGGGIYNIDTITNNISNIQNSTISGNSALIGGGIYNLQGSINNIQNSMFSGNSGSGIYNNGTISIIQDSTFSGNSNLLGGGINNDGIITTIQNSTFSGNSVGIHGGGIYNRNSISTIHNSTFSGNSSDGRGAGIYNFDTITTIQNSTFSGNSAVTNGGGIRNFNGTIGTLRNSLFHNNTSGGTECAHEGTGSINGSNNLSDNLTSDCPDVSLLTTSTVGSLADNGGSTMTHALLPNSEAIDAGNGDSTTTDQRGYTAANTRDIGAFESFVPVVTAPMDISVEATGPLTSPALGFASVSDVDESGLIAIGSPADNFALGMTTVTWTSTDSYGFIGTDTQVVTIVDTTDPVVTSPSNISIEATGPLTSVKLGTATAIDLVDGALMPTADNSGPFPVGETIVTWSVTDANNNTGSATQTVTITDNTAPVITLIGENPQLIQETQSYSELGATATDLLDDDMALTATIVIDDSDVDTDVPGMYEVTYNVMDAAGNVANTMVRDVEVTADIPVANNDSYSTNEDIQLNSIESMLDNDNDPDNDGLTVVNTGVSTMIGMGGSINISANGTFVYTPVDDVSGTDELSYLVTDGTSTVAATITITVNPVNDAPTFTVMGDVDVTGLVDVINDFVEVPDFIENIVFGPADESGQSIDTITTNPIDPDNVINAVSIDNNGLLRIDINIGNYGTAIVEVQLKDDGGTANDGVDTSEIVDFIVIYDDLIFGNGFEDTSSRLLP